MNDQKTSAGNPVKTETDDTRKAGFHNWLGQSGSRDVLVRLAASVLRDSHEAEDVVQDTLLAVWRAYSEGNVDNLQAYALGFFRPGDAHEHPGRPRRTASSPTRAERRVAHG